MPRTFVCREGELREGEGRTVALLPGRSAYVFRYRGTVRAFLSRCPHMGGPVALAPGAGKLVCHWHEASFDPVTGARAEGRAPAGSCLEALGIEEADGALWVRWERPADPFEGC